MVTPQRHQATALPTSATDTLWVSKWLSDLASRGHGGKRLAVSPVEGRGQDTGLVPHIVSTEAGTPLPAATGRFSLGASAGRGSRLDISFGYAF